MKYGIVDIGSNTIRLNVYRVEGEEFSLLFTKKYTAGLVSYIEGKCLSEKGIRKMIYILNGINTIAREVEIDELDVFATAFLRKVSNKDEVLKRMRKSADTEIELISDKEEAELGNLGVSQLFRDDNTVTIDVGGGSTEIVYRQDDGKNIINLAEGSLSLYTEYTDKIIPTQKEIKEMRSYIRKSLSVYDNLPNCPTMIGIGGTVRAAGNILCELNDRDAGAVVSFKELKEFLKNVNSKENIRMILQVAPARVHTLVPGLVILLESARLFKSENLIVSSYGVREGYLLHRLKSKKAE